MLNKPQLFCFTFAGGTADFFNLIENDLVGINCVKLEYAGHGKRHKESFYNSFEELADDMFRNVNRLYGGGDYGLFGYSMGVITLVEVLKRIEENNMRRPKNVFLAAHEPLTKLQLFNYSADEQDEWVKKRTIEFGAVPERLVNNHVFWRTYLPMYRADYSIICNYDFEKVIIHSDIPAMIFYSETDTPFENMRKWERSFTCEYVQFPGNHFFIQQHHEEMGRIIRAKMGV